MQKIVNRKAVNLKLFLILSVMIGGVLYFSYQQFYRLQQNKKIELINFFIKKGEFQKADREINHYINNFEITEEIIWIKIKLFQVRKEAINDDYKSEIIKQAFLAKSFFNSDLKKVNLLLGETYYEKGENYFPQSKYYLEEHIAGNGEENLNPKIVKLLYEINLKLGAIEEAHFYAEKLVENNPDDLGLKIKLIEVLLLRKKNIEAQKKLEEIIINQSYNPFTLKASKLLLTLLNQFNLEQKMNFYNDYISVKFKTETEFMKDYLEYYQKLKSNRG